MGLWDTAAETLAAARSRRAVAGRLAELDLTPHQTLREEIEEWAAEHGARPALATADGTERLGYDDLAGRVARWARWAILHGIGRGEPVALVMANRPERLAAWFGLAAAGAVALLLDPATDGRDLAAAITAAAPKHVVVDGALLPRFEAAAPHLGVAAMVWVHGPHTMAYPRLDEALAELSSERLRPVDRRPVAATDDALWLPTTTGEIRRLDHRRVIRSMHAAAAAAGARRDDRLWLPDLTLADPAAALAAGVTLTVGGLAVLEARAPSDAPAAITTPGPATLVAWDAASDADDRIHDEARPDATAPARPRLGLAIGLDTAAAAAGADRRRLPRHLRWCDGDLLAASGVRLHGDAAVGGA
jgi:fatty-acyl-CoA synthase